MLEKKYKRFQDIDLPNRRWCSKGLTKAPRFCSIDLRDGNQALAQPMNLETKLRFFETLISMGFKEIEIGFPSSSNVEFDFTRKLIDDGLIPDDVTIQVMTQAKLPLIKKTFEAVAGGKNVIIHLYTSLSPEQREVVLRKSKEEMMALTLEGAQAVVEEARRQPETSFTFEYTPESFTQAEIGYSIEVMRAVCKTFMASKAHPVILNLPSTVENLMPNQYADLVETVIDHLDERESVVISLHTHNDRGTGIAACELGLLAGGERVEGTLFGNGERTGNCDLIVLSLNLFSSGIDPKLDLSNLPHIVDVYQESVSLPIHIRHPYAGELAFTAFSGSHQDAIAKGLSALQDGETWSVPYLPIDPLDIGRSRADLVRITSQSGKGGAAYILHTRFGVPLPKAMHVELYPIIQKAAEMQGELLADEVLALFSEHFIGTAPLEGGLHETYEKLCVATSKKLLIHDVEEHRLKDSYIAFVSLSIDGKEPKYGACIDSDFSKAAAGALLKTFGRQEGD